MADLEIMCEGFSTKNVHHKIPDEGEEAQNNTRDLIPYIVESRVQHEDASDQNCLILNLPVIVVASTTYCCTSFQFCLIQI